MNSPARKSLLDRAAALTRWPAVVELAFVTIAGHAGGMEALRAASADLAEGRTEIAIVLGVDSLLDDEILNWLQVCGRLKSDAAPAGLQPGEAAAAIMLMASSAAQVKLHARVAHVDSASEVRALLAGENSTGESLAKIMSSGMARGCYGTPMAGFRS